MASNQENQDQAVKYGKFEMPSKISFDSKKSTNTYARFIAEPFERGFGHTIGNSLRRMMLTSLEAPAVVSMRIQGVPLEYMAIEGVIEDMTNIVLNVKGVLLRKLPFEGESRARDSRIITCSLDVTQSDLDENGGKVEVTIGDLITTGSYEVVNPAHHLFTVTVPMKKQIDFRVSIGRGYVPSERHVITEKATDEIIVDSAFSPVTLVNYWVENTRVGQDTDYDRLVLDVHTDGRVTPLEALNFASQIIIKHLEIFKKVQAFSLVFDHEGDESASDRDEIMDKLALRIDEIELSVRSTNCLSGANIETIAELVTIPERRMLEFRNFGKKSLNEIKAKLTDMGLGLGMDLARYGINSDNVKDKIRQYQEEKKALKDSMV